MRKALSRCDSFDEEGAIQSLGLFLNSERMFLLVVLVS